MIYNTLSGRIEEFKPLEEGVVKLYTCGPTVYDYAHIGNFRSYVAEDLLKRFLKFLGYRVIHVMNITDVDDKTIAGARAEGISLKGFTAKYEKAFFEDIETLRLDKADYYPKATEHVEDMIKIIQGLLEKGYAYEKEGSIYFRISSFPEYGKLSKIKKEELKAGIRIDADEYEKEDVRDFALWKAKKPGEPSWPAPFGEGRPGWHIECSAMSMKYLGPTIDIHARGVDNIFPHHENEIAQSEAYTGKQFVRYWFHVQHLIVNGEKMSKSKGNFYTLRDLLSMGFSPRAIRYLLLTTHYRKVLNFTFDALYQATASLKRITDFLFELETRNFSDGQTEEARNMIEKTKKDFTAALLDDLNISGAIAAIFEMIHWGNKAMEGEKLKKKDAEQIKLLFYDLDRVLAILPEKIIEELPDEIMELIKKREEARKNRDFATADAIRDELFKKGIILEDTKEGTRWKIIKT
ncbi:MAG: cysteine--tRNA ligase [Candidatus Aminicenantes bacterium]|nr:cysteine--tRNA ligase [Candidatus Aminicenantes bacterium]